MPKHTQAEPTLRVATTTTETAHTTVMAEAARPELLALVHRMQAAPQIQLSQALNPVAVILLGEV